MADTTPQDDETTTTDEQWRQDMADEWCIEAYGDTYTPSNEWGN
ncbi:hypothetical protein [Streptomyces sp. AM6-12]